MDSERKDTDNTDTPCPARREALKRGIALVPVLVTLHARPAFAQTDYSVVAYRYGVNAGMVNKNFGKENARPNFKPADEVDSGDGTLDPLDPLGGL